MTIDRYSRASLYRCNGKKSIYKRVTSSPSDPADSPLSYTYIYDITKLAYTYMEHSTLQHYIKRRSLYTPLCLESRLRVFVYDTISTPASAFPPRNDGAIVSCRRIRISWNYIGNFFSLSLFFSRPTRISFFIFFLLLRLHCKICTTLRPAVAAELVRTGGNSLFHALWTIRNRGFRARSP